MSKDPKQYEMVVKKLLENKLSLWGLPDPKIYHLKKYRGASGQMYEIDISFEILFGGIQILILVECKCYKKAVGLDDVAEFAYKLRDIGAHKGIIVTTNGFQAGALKIAKREGIALVRAVSSWFVIAPCLTGERAEYVIYEETATMCGRFRPFGSYRLPKGSTYPPGTSVFSRYATGSLSESSNDAEVGFFPEIGGFYAEPMNIIRAAQIYCIEESIDSGILNDLKVIPL